MALKLIRGLRHFWKLLLVVIGVFIGLGLSLSWMTAAARRTAEDTLTASLEKAFLPHVDIHTSVFTSLGELKKHSKWVVLTTTLDVSVTKESRKAILWDMLDLGTTTVSLKVPGNRVQYVVDLKDVGPQSFTLDGSELVMTVPAPRVDEDIVEVQSDPSKINAHTEVGWARLKSRSGERLRQQALAEIRPLVLKEALAEPLLLQARIQAELEMKKLLAPLIPLLRPGVVLQIRFREE